MTTENEYHMIYPADRWVTGDWLLVKASDAIANNGLEDYDLGTFATATTPATGARWAGTGETITVDEAISILLDTGDITVVKHTAHANIDAAPTRVVPEMVACDCGHECGAAMVMSASVGTSCPDCYDMMSD